ncbi:MAG: tetratricopeptide repeat protein, partial [Gammaproteobacteria bacterium]
MQSISVTIVVICLLVIILCAFVYKIKANTLETIQKSASQGNAKDQYYLGLIYMHGNGIEQDDTLAIHWLQKAAEQGCQKALNNLSIIHERGIVRLDKYEDSWFHSYYE